MNIENFRQILLWPLELRLPQNQKVESLVEFLKEPSFPWKPVDYYSRCPSDDPDWRYAEFVYFHTFVQRFLYPDPSTAHEPGFVIFGRDDVAKLYIELSGGQPETLDVLRVHLYLFQTQIAILVVEVAAHHTLTREQTLLFQDQFRRVYPPYFCKPDGVTTKAGNCPTLVQWLDKHGVPIGERSDYAELNSEKTAPKHRSSVEAKPARPPVSAHWAWLLDPLSFTPAAQSYSVSQIEDDRIPAMSYIAVPNPRLISSGDFARFCFLDGDGDSSRTPYAAAFLKDFPVKHCYDRFWDPSSPHDSGFTTRYLCCGYSFTVIAKSGEWFVDVKLKNDFRHHYFQLGLLAHYHRASLLRFSRRFNETNAGPGGDLEELRNTQSEFADFIANHWFHEVSNQEQARELFSWWSRLLGNELLMTNMQTEAAAVDRILTARRRHELEKIEQRRQGDMDSLARKTHRLSISTDTLTTFLYWLTGLTLSVAFLDTEVVRQAVKKQTIHFLGARDWLWLKPEAWASLILFLPLALFLGLGYFFIRKKTNKEISCPNTSSSSKQSISTTSSRTPTT
jgi:hypothetical protein